MINGVIFDMDGIIFDSERIYSAAWYAVGTRMNMADIDASVKHCVGRNGKDIRAFLLGKYGPAFSTEQFSEDIKQTFEAMTAADGLPLKPGVRELLSWLHDVGIRIGLATSTGKKSAERHLQDAGLLPYFRVVITGDMIQNGKPDPEIYRVACTALGIQPEAGIAIEDSPNGIKSAYGAGLKVIMVPDLIEPTGEIEKLLFKRFDKLLDVKGYFETIEGSFVHNGPFTGMLHDK